MKIRTLNPATVIASLALLFSLSGTAVAGALITGANVKNNSIAGIDILNESLGTKDVRNGSLLPKDFKVLPVGPQGPAGPAGPHGPAGPQGLTGLSGLEIVNAASAMNSDEEKSVTVTCPGGKKVLGGGGFAANLIFPDDVVLMASNPNGTNGWRVAAQETHPNAQGWLVRAYAICANVS